MELQIDVSLDYAFEQPCTVLLQIEVAACPGQTVEASAVSGAAARARLAAQDDVGTRMWLAAEGRMRIDYAARISITRPAHDLAALPAAALCALPATAVPT